MSDLPKPKPSQDINGAKTLRSILRGVIEAIPLRWRTKLTLTQDITPGVPTETQPEDLDGNVVVSTVEQARTNEKDKTTISANFGDVGPLVENIVTPEGLRAQRVVALVSTADPAPASDDLTLQTDQQAFGNGKSEQSVTTAESYPSQPGQHYNQELDTIEKFTEQVGPLGIGVGNPNTDSDPVDFSRSRERVWDLTAIKATLDAYISPLYGNTALDIPDQLTGISVDFQGSSGAGAYSETGFATLVGPGTAGISLNGDAQGSAAAMPEVTMDIVKRAVDRIPYTDYYFFAPKSYSRTQVIARLNTLISGSVLDSWPVSFTPKSITLILKGQSLSLQGRSNAHLSVTTNGAGITALAAGSGAGSSYNYDITIRAVTISPTIHGALTITGATASQSTSCQSATVITSYATGDTGTLTGTVNASVSPTSISSSGVSIPSSGFYIINLDMQPYKYGYTAVRARVINAANIP